MANRVVGREAGRRRRATPEGQEARRAANRRYRSTPEGLKASRAAARAANRVARDRLRARTEAEADADFRAKWPDGKPCYGCGEVLPANAYLRNWTTTDGRERRCALNGCYNRHQNLKKWGRLVMGWIARGLDPDHCAYCLRPIGPGDRDVDHFIAVARGGTDDPSNLCPSCPDCNRGQGGKFDRDAFEWLAATHPDRVDFFRELFPELNLEPSIP